ncbi:conjugal transfer protein TraR [Halobiforma lacisalsi AJ5]|uniref:CaCA family Na+/Ca+ antiporter n=1 Tax=Natronobacterium lacisalsi AJ5 TaxID=358396 RepID=M0L3P5_NATLA|nr:calcium/sodium antiporter [Halobiforma lacisalsi]APW98183.1 conjugal transfer protein TraR [Halobiforma lacisalsi AJ5]EMA28166.1 CaCA family Na+/Ca+ antiporter [Halobiforma lacisalsi AJ5]
MNVVSVGVGILALWLGARWLVDGAANIAGDVGVSPLVVGLTVVAFGTSSPELVVSASAAFSGGGDVAVGNVIGSNVFNVAIILGVVAVLSPFRVTETLLRRDVLAMVATTAIATVVLVDLSVTRLEGGVLAALLASYVAALWISVRGSDGPASDQPFVEGASTESKSVGAIDGTDPDTVRIDRWRDGGRLLVGLISVVVGGRLLVESATAVALSLGVSQWLIGVTVVAAGTSLPELVTSVVATRRGDVAIAAGNVVGSNVFNFLGVLGVAALVRPLTVDGAVLGGLLWVGALTLGAATVLATGRQLTRLEGVALLLAGIGYWIASAL